MPNNNLAALDRIDKELDKRLRAAQAEISRLERELTAAKQVRLAIIDEAMQARWSHQRIGDSLGLSKQRVAQLRRGSEANGEAT